MKYNLKKNQKYDIVHDGLTIEKAAKIIKLEDAKLFFQSQNGKTKWITEEDINRCEFIKIA